MPGRLTIVPTPVGNLEDMTFRAVRALKECAFILAEDTRTSSVVMKEYGITAPMVPYHLNNEHRVVDGIVQRIRESEAGACLVTDAGTPGISDPGYLIIRTCIDEGLEVTCLPGPTAFVPALVASGLPCDRFRFEGFLPPKKGRASKLAEIADREVTTVLYESPLRLVRLLGEIVTLISPDRRVAVAREISKIHETFHRGTAQDLLDYFSENPPLGEIVVLVSPVPKKEKEHRNKFL